MKMEKIPGGVTAVSGVEAAGVHCGIKKNKEKDLALLYYPRPARAAGVFTRNLFKAPPLQVTRDHLQNPVRAVVINSGNANACTGEQGRQDALATTQLVAEKLQVPAEEVLVSSTGVIGVYLPMGQLARGVEEAVLRLSPSMESGYDAARAIMTTDTVPKEAAYRVQLDSVYFTVGGMAKGAGMICPDMATLLGFICTDLDLSRDALQVALRWAVERSFNVITVDGDTSTNDMVLLVSTGISGIKVEPGTSLWESFREALFQVCQELSYRIVSDGEGVTKVIRLVVQGAPDYQTARTLSRAVLNSCLVKTAFFGEDANWGRLITAMGYSGAAFDPSAVDIFLGDVQVTRQGTGVIFDETRAKKVLEKREIPVFIHLHAGEEELTSYGCDLSYDYVTINSDYRS